MKRLFTTLLLSGALWGQVMPSQQDSATLLFANSDSAAALRESAQELRRNPADANAIFVHMEAARLQLLTREELHDAIALLRITHGADSRARLAADRVRELAVNTPAFRSALPELMALLRASSRYSREISDALLAARADGVQIPRTAHLTSRLTRWQVAGPFGEFSNVDFDRSWPPEQDQLRAASYGARVRESLIAEAGNLELPNYFPQTGVYYAASNFRLTAARKYKITVESDGTFELKLDGKPLLVHDARFHSQKKISIVQTSLIPGEHRLMLKLKASAMPLRVWLEKEGRYSPERADIPKSEQFYLRAANALLDSDPQPALSIGSDSSSIEQTLLADALSQIEQEQKQREALQAAAKNDPNDALAIVQLARLAFESERFGEAITYLARVLQASADYWPAQELKYQIAFHFDWTQERAEALRERLRLHPSCGAFLEAAKLRESSGKRARTYESKLSTCSSKPYPYWERLAERGEHERVLASVIDYARWHSADRRVLEIAIREAVLSSDKVAAARYAQALAHVAPNWRWAGMLANNPESILDSRSAYAPANDFYKPYIRDALSMMGEHSEPTADSRILINDRVVKLEAGGSAWIYQHTVTQVLNKNGIERGGEVELPRSAELLELRTIKRDGTFVEPELSENKKTISMPSLAPGDAVEVAYVQHFRSDALRSNPELLDFAFGSTESPTHSSRLIIIRDGAPEPLLWHSPEVYQFAAEHQSNAEAIAWEALDLTPATQEPGSPRYERRPRILWLSMDVTKSMNVADRYRDELIEAAKITPQLELLASQIGGSSAHERIAAAYQYVMSSIEESDQNFQTGNVPSASESFAAGEGNRTAALLALLSAMGFDADLELTTDVNSYGPKESCPALRCYTHPLVRVTLPSSKPLLLDPEMDGLAAGALSPEVEGQPAFLISRERPANDQIVTVPHITDERSQATANLQLDENGGIRGTIHIRFGSLRGAQMRENLRQLSAKDRQTYFEEIASRILPNAGKVSASLRHENNPESPLELELKTGISIPSHWTEPTIEVGQLIPALGLGRLYATLPERRDDLLLETPLVEDSEFFVHLPPGVEASHLPEAANLKSSFGEYHTEFKVEDGVLTVVRSFRIPVQQITPAEYSAFSKFALQIDNAESELLELRRSSVARNASAAPISH